MEMTLALSPTSALLLLVLLPPILKQGTFIPPSEKLQLTTPLANLHCRCP